MPSVPTWPHDTIGSVLPPDNHVHTEWSWQAPGEASMARSCEQALVVGVPSVAFTDHLDFTTWTDGDRISTENLDPHRYSRMHLLDVDGYRRPSRTAASGIRTCGYFPGPRSARPICGPRARAPW